MLRHLLPVLATLTALVAPAAADAAAPVVSEYLAPDKGVNALAQGPNGDLWFTSTENPGRVGRITPLGGLTAYSTAEGLSKDAKPGAITAGPGGMWLTLTAKNRIARVTETGGITEFPLGPVGKPTGIALGPDGNLWYTAVDHDSGIGRLTPAGVATEFTTGLTKDSRPQDITRGPDGALWFTEPAANRIGRITTSGLITEYATGASAGTPREIVAGPDGNLWFTLPAATPAIGRITPSGTVTLFSSGLPLGSEPEGIAAGADGAMWFTDRATNAVGRITTSGAVTMVSGGITASADLRGIAAGSDGAMWFAEFRGAIGRVTVAPAAEGVTASSVTSSAATLTGSLRPNAQTTTAYLEIGTTTTYGQSTAPQNMGISGSSQTLTATLSGLTPQTTYHARVVATNATGTSYGPDRTFRTTALNAPSATTEAATEIEGDRARLNALVDPEGNATTYRFEWGTTDAYGSRLPLVDATVGSDTATHAVHQTLTGLQPNTTYHFRVVASSPAGETAGADETFTTDAVAPELSGLDAVGVSAAGATLTGAVNARNSAATYRYEWGLTTAYEGSASEPEGTVAADDVPHTVTRTLAGLEPNTTYHFRLVASSAGETVAGPDRTFTTAMALPLVTTGVASDVTAGGATLNGAADPRKALTVVWFEYGTTPVLGSATPPRALGASDLQAHAVTAGLTGLAPATTYHVRLAASSGAGVVYGPVVTFTTAALPVPVPVPDQPTSPAAEQPAPAAPAPAPSPAPAPAPAVEPVPASDDAEQPAPVPAAVPKPALGTSVVAGVVSGTVKVRAPDGSAFSSIVGADDLPSGSVIDAREGTMRLVTALDSRGRTQEATFRGARFRVVQAKGAGGMVDIHLAEEPAGCGARKAVAGKIVGRAAGAAAKKGKTRTLWAQDRGGKYRTHAKNSVTTVRGTKWSTTETCAGTRTTVTEGAVSVRDKRTGRSTLVKAGRSYLARARR